MPKWHQQVIAVAVEVITSNVWIDVIEAIHHILCVMCEHVEVSRTSTSYQLVNTHPGHAYHLLSMWDSPQKYPYWDTILHGFSLSGSGSLLLPEVYVGLESCMVSCITTQNRVVI